MTEIDFIKLQSLSPANLTDDDILYLFKIFSTYDFGHDVRFDELKLLFALALEVLKFKGEEAAFYELESKHYAAALGSENVKNEDQNREDLRQQLLQYDVQNSQLTAELKICEKELLAERNETEKLVGKVAVLERENVSLSKEVASLREETNEQSLLSEAFHESSDTTVEKHQELMNSICQKNKHISQLLTDIEVLEKENLMLRDKIAAVQNELSLATKHITELSGQSTSLKFSCREKEEKLVDFEQQNLGLRNQVQEMVQQNILRDSQLDDFSQSFYDRIKQWEDILKRKNIEIEVLQTKVAELSNQTDTRTYNNENNQMRLLTETLHKREEQIEKLQQQLTEAATEINDSATLIETLKNNKFGNVDETIDTSSLTKLKSQLELAEEKMELLEDKLKDAEEDAKCKAAETSEMIVQLREYESGEFGLADAVSALKATRAQCRLREGDALAAVQMANRLQLTMARLREQNFSLRKKLNLPLENDMIMDDRLIIDDGEEEIMVALKRRAEQLEEEKVQLKLENRKLLQRINDISGKVNEISGNSPHKAMEMAAGSPKRGPNSSEKLELVCSEADSFKENNKPSHLGSDLNVESNTSVTMQCQKAFPTSVQLVNGDAEMEKQLTEFIKENEALRKGMHEILDCIRNQDGSSDVQVHSECLERLLEALDLRHVSGWYHPAMRLQAQLKAIEGSNAALREQLRTTRLEERKAREDCEREKLKKEHLEITLQCSQKENEYKKTCFEELPPLGNACDSSANLIEKLNFHLLEVMNETMKTEDVNKSLEYKWEKISKKYSMMRHEIGLLYLEYAAAKADWQSKLQEATAQREAAERCAQLLQGETGDADSEEPAALRRMSVLLAERSQRLAQAERRGRALQAAQGALQRRCEQMARDMWEMECAVTKLLRNLLCQMQVSAGDACKV